MVRLKRKLAEVLAGPMVGPYDGYMNTTYTANPRCPECDVALEWDLGEATHPEGTDCPNAEPEDAPACYHPRSCRWCMQTREACGTHNATQPGHRDCTPLGSPGPILPSPR